MSSATSATMTNGYAIRSGIIPCETNPSTGALSRTTEPYHDMATVTVGQSRGSLRHVCPGCAEKYHRHQKRREGIVWQ